VCVCVCVCARARARVCVCEERNLNLKKSGKSKCLLTSVRHGDERSRAVSETEQVRGL